MGEPYSTETIVQLLIRLEQGQERLETKLDDQRAEFVSHAVWVQRNGRVDYALKSLEDDVRELKASRAPWTSVASVVVAAAALAVALIPQLAG